MEANVLVRINASAPKATRETCVQSVSTKTTVSVFVVGASSWLYSIFLHNVRPNCLFRLIYFLDIQRTPDLRELWKEKGFLQKPPHSFFCTLSFYKAAMCQLTNSSLVIKKCLIKRQYIAMLKSNGSTLWGVLGAALFSHWFCSICFSSQRLSQTLPGNRGGEMFWGSAPIQCKVTDLLWEPQAVTGPARHEEQKQGKHICNPVCGWNIRRSGVCAHCVTAVCEPGCGPYGTCTEPNKCQCKEGWHGRHCNKSKWETNPESPCQGSYTSDATQKWPLQEPLQPH